MTETHALDAYREDGEIALFEMALYDTSGQPITDPRVAAEAVSFLFNLSMEDAKLVEELPGMTIPIWLAPMDGVNGHSVAAGVDVGVTDGFSGYRAWVPGRSA